MAILTDTGSTLIIDRTLANMPIPLTASQLDCDKLGELAQLLLMVGADLLELTDHMMKIDYLKYPRQLIEKSIMRVATLASFITAIENGFKYFIIPWELAQELSKLDQWPNSLGVTDNGSTQYQVLVELPGEVWPLLELGQNQWSWLGKLHGEGIMQGISWQLPPNITSHQLAEFLPGISSSFPGQFNICPSNQYDLATSVILEGIALGSHYVTTSFAGIGSSDGKTLAPIEEVLVAAQIGYNWQAQGNLQQLPRLVRLFEELRGCAISAKKPIIGSEIFSCESGIHVAGIQRDSSTYEPYAPQLVGLDRKLVLGKHSGTGAVVAKLAELGCTCLPQTVNRLVKQVGELSIRQRGAVSDQQFLELFMNSSPGEELKWAHGQ